MKKPIAIQQYEQGIPFRTIYPNYDIKKLPTWLQPYIEEARLFGKSNQMVVLPDGAKYQLNNQLNDLSGGDWLKFTNSVFSTWYPTTGEKSYAHNIRRIHPTPKPPQLMKEIIEFFTKENEYVLDYFMGVGGTLLGAALCQRKAIGIDLNPTYIEAYQKAAKELKLEIMPTICSDSLQALKNPGIISEMAEGNNFSLILIDPPYGNMMSKKKTGADIAKYGKKSTPFTSSANDLGNMTQEEWLNSLKKSIELSMPLLKKRGYYAIFIKDLQPIKKQVNLLHADIINSLNEIPNLYYKGLKIWEDKSAKLFPYGYPLSFVANQTHQYIIFFRKER